MELSCTEVPLYGQVTVFAKFDNNIYLPEDAEFYFIYNGSNLRHVMFAQRLSDNTLQSIVPGHGSQETVSVTVCMYTMGYSPVTVGCSSVTYAQDTACMLSNYLVSQAGFLTPDSHRTVLDRFRLTVENLCSLDHEVMLAMSHADFPTAWSILGKGCDGETINKECLLHLAMRWGLEKLSNFLLSLPGGASALTLANEEGETPLDLAARNGHTRLVELFANFQGIPTLDFTTAVIGDSAFLRFDQPSRVLTLTFNHTTEYSLESDIKLLRRCLWDKTFLTKVLNLKDVRRKGLPMHFHIADKEEDPKTCILILRQEGIQEQKQALSCLLPDVSEQERMALKY